jgi:hypothetical protein
MKHWIKRWRDWAMTKIWPLNRLSQPQTLHFSYEKAGLTIVDQPVPWNAEAVLVEVLMQMSHHYRVKTDFTVRTPGLPNIPAESLRARDDVPNGFRVHYRLPPLSRSATLQVFWREKQQGQLTIPVLSRDDFIQSLRLQMPTVFARLGNEAVACQTFVATQCHGLLVTGTLSSPTSLVPLLDLELQVEFRHERDAEAHRFPVRLSSSQLNGRTALLCVAPRKLPRRMGVWTINWLLGDHCLATQRVRAISVAAFQKSLRISDTRFLIQDGGGSLALSRSLPSTKTAARIGPCFFVSSSEQGMAGLCAFNVRAQVPGAIQPPLLLEQDVLITDGPTLVAPGTIEAVHLEQLQGFELCLRKKVLGIMPLHPAPIASFNAEGGFKPIAEYAWSPIAEDELAEKLAQLTRLEGIKTEQR